MNQKIEQRLEQLAEVQNMANSDRMSFVALRRKFDNYDFDSGKDSDDMNDLLRLEDDYL